MNVTDGTDVPSFMARNPELRELIKDSDPNLAAGLNAAMEDVVQYYKTYAVNLPDDSAWKHGKLEHIEQGLHGLVKHAEQFGLDEVEERVLAFLLVAHDTGRLLHEHIQDRTDAPLPWRHGEESSLFAIRALGEYAKTPLGKIMVLAIKHHSDIKTPTLEDFDGFKPAHALTGLVRDLDKMSGYDDAKRYTADEVFRRKQIHSNYRTHRKQDPTWGEERGCIDPPQMLDTFLSGNALERRACKSYEAYMLQYLAWMFDIQNAEVLDLCIAQGGPKIVLDYILTQLAAENGDKEQYNRLFEWAASWKGGILARTPSK